MASLSCGGEAAVRPPASSVESAKPPSPGSSLRLGAPTTGVAAPPPTKSPAASSAHLATDGRTLSELFDAATAKWHLLDTGADTAQSTIESCIAEFEACAKIIRVSAIFSSNETLRDLSTRRLSYLLVPLRLADLQDKIRVDLSNGPGPRLRLLERADGYLGSFLQQCINHQIPDSVDAERYTSFMEGDAAREDHEPSTFAAMDRSKCSPEVERERKLLSYQRHRAAQKRIAEILEIRARRQRHSKASHKRPSTGVADDGEDDGEAEDTDGLERERVLLVLRSGVRDALDMLVSHTRELPMLRHMMKMMGAQTGSAGGQRADPRTRAKREKERKAQQMRDYENRPGLSLTHIGPDGSVRREQLKAQVFRPGWRQPTMSLDELAEIEVRDAMARKERQEAAEADSNRPGMKMKELEEAGKEDDTELVDKATQRDRQWDNWKDMNPRGYGVTKKI